MGSLKVGDSLVADFCPAEVESLEVGEVGKLVEGGVGDVSIAKKRAATVIGTGNTAVRRRRVKNRMIASRCCWIRGMHQRSTSAASK